ncbi:complex I intermediate-associated protein 30-domain-containing protein [Scenedesmus sp. NREL 46B-D3]|nr:complex I intermediate-associated protein 30-domain-containing protein [Scenedesmus sp. NREL 46B-D3]
MVSSAVQLAPKPVVLYSFNSQKVVDQWHVFTDSFFGGKSQASLTYNQAEQAAEFSGRCTLDQDEDADIKRAGYCVAASQVHRIGEYHDLCGFSHLVYNVKGDGRTYIANVRVDSMAGTGGDVWQAPFRPSAGVWSQVSIPIDSLALTYQGQLVERKLDFQADKVISVGVSVSAATPEVASSSSSSSSSSVRWKADGQAAGADSSSGGDSSSTNSSSGLDEDANSTANQVDASEAQPHELFRLLIHDIRAEGEL